MKYLLFSLLFFSNFKESDETSGQYAWADPRCSSEIGRYEIIFEAFKELVERNVLPADFFDMLSTFRMDPNTRYGDWYKPIIVYDNYVSAIYSNLNGPDPLEIRLRKYFYVDYDEEITLSPSLTHSNTAGTFTKVYFYYLVQINGS